MNSAQLWWCDVTDWWDYKLTAKQRMLILAIAFAAAAVAGAVLL